MFKNILKASVAASVLMLAGCGQEATDTSTDVIAEAPAAKAELGSFGIDLTARNEAVKPGDDFFSYASGTWYDNYVLPDDKTSFGAFNALHERSQEQVKVIIQALAEKGGEEGSPEQMVGDYYASYMDTATVDSKGMAPLMPTLKAIAAISDIDGLTAALGRAGRDDSRSPISAGLGINRLDPSKYQLGIGTGGLGLPDRDYYLEEGNERFDKIKAAYLTHIAEMMALAGVEDGAAKADAIMALETKIAGHLWPRAERRNRDKTLNPHTMAELKESFSGLNWDVFFEATGYDVNELNVSHPSAMTPLIALISGEDLETWKAYLTFHAISGNSFLLSDEIYQANFKFRGTTLSGQPKPRDRWKRGVSLLSGTNSLGEAIGQVYVKKHFPESAKAQMEELVENLRTAMGERIDNLEWMGDETKAKAQEKLAAFNPKIAYPNKWRSYEGLNIQKGDLFGNYKRVQEFFHAFDVARINRETDKEEWFMTPQTVNAYYNPAFNEIVFPAAILGAPFFDPAADAAVNYGGIGAVIGHEMGHGFDDQGSKSDANGVQTNWWTDEDRANFEERTTMLVAQYNAYEPIDGTHVDGSFTLGENIGDVGGIAMAYHAYKLSLKGAEAPIIDGLTGDQRFFLAWAQVWRSKMREQALLQRLKSDPHSPAKYRTIGGPRNHDAWYEAFDVQPGDAMYLAPEERVRIW